MNKLITRNSRSTFGALLLLCAMMMIVGMICINIRGASDSVRSFGNLILFGIMFGLIGLGFYFAWATPNATELAKAAAEERETEHRITEARAALTVKYVPFKELAWTKKSAKVGIFLAGLAYVVLGIMIWTGFFPELKDAHGKIIGYTNHELGSAFTIGGIGFGCFAFIAFQSQLVDKWKERFNHFLKEIDDETGGK
jgi:hypothetical protein